MIHDVYLVATGAVFEGRETYTRHDQRPPLCDAELLQTPFPEDLCDALRQEGYAEGRYDEHEVHAVFRSRVLALLAELEVEAILSEGQCAKVWGGDLLDWRMASRPAPHPFAQEGT